MALFKVNYRPAKSNNLPGKIIYQISHENCYRDIATDLYIYHSEWDFRRKKVIVPQTNNPRQSYLKSVRRSIALDKERFSRIVKRWDDNNEDYTAPEIITEIMRYRTEYTLSQYMQAQIDKKLKSGKIRTAETYKSALSNFVKFRNGKDLALDELTSGIIINYNTWQINREITRNTISFYNRIIRAVYNRAVHDGITEDKHPFREVYTGVDKTIKRAVPLPYLKKIIQLNLEKKPSLEYARDMFIMSFLLRGMNLIDMAYLKKSDLKNGIITYRRQKTGQMLNIRWLKEMQQILDKYPRKNTDYLLPILPIKCRNIRDSYRKSASEINKNLKTIASMAGLPLPLTLYCARHSWATLAHNKGIPISVISEGLGHDSENTTRIYLSSLDTSSVDKANSLLVKTLIC